MKTTNNFQRAIFQVAVIGFWTSPAALIVDAQQRNDPQFDTKIERPAHTKKHPRVLIDGAHNNVFSVLTKRAEPLAQLMGNDGLVVETGKDAFSHAVLKPYDLLVILTAQGKDNPTAPTFTDDEIDSVHTWVNDGGSMLFCMDHTPFAESGRKLGERFGINVFLGNVSDPGTADLWFGDKDFRTPLYTRANQGLADHPVTRGREEAERVDKVGVFGGVSLAGPKKSWNLFTLSKTATNGENGRPGEGLGTSQAIAMNSGKGRIVITADCSMWTAQLVTANQKEHQYGMARTDLGNRQFALNVVRWLTRTLK